MYACCCLSRVPFVLLTFVVVFWKGGFLGVGGGGGLRFDADRLNIG